QMELALLGVAKGHYALSIIKSLQKLASRGLSLSYFSETLKFSDFDKYFSEAHVAICPFKKWYRLGLNRDEFGKQSISGVMNDLIYYGKPALVSRFHPFPVELEKQVTRYGTAQELANFLVEFYQGGSKTWTYDLSPIYNQDDRAQALNSWLSKLIQ
ncbi:MAG: hypothetical protein OEQ53_19135, partial [Saprospiraceae bacterium]|nr:hypothetical protein [Saprospiraceae bacterium]